MAGRAVNFLVMVDEQAVMKDGGISFFFELAVFEDRGEENDVERLPLAGPAAGRGPATPDATDNRQRADSWSVHLRRRPTRDFRFSSR